MNGKDKLSIVPFTFFFFLGLYVVIKFFLVVFWTLNFNPRFIMELTPFFLLKMNPVQLFILSAIVAGSDAYFHFQNHGKNIVYSFVPTALMIVGIGTAIYVYEWNNPLYYLLFAAMLGVAVVDHRYLLHVNGYFKEGEEERSVEELKRVADRERMLEEEMERPRKDLEKAKAVSEIEVGEEAATEEEEELERMLEEEKIGEELKEIPEKEMKEIPEVPEGLVEKIERKGEMEIIPPEEGEIEGALEQEKAEKERKEKEEGLEDLEALIEELLEFREKKKGAKEKECPICGAMNPPDAKYCKECGSELEGGR